jgi:uncharacterized Zn finger protein
MCKHVAATLYGVGARLDTSPELLFVLRGADHLELVTEVAESVTAGASNSSDSSATLAGENLEEVFGIEIELAAPETSRAAASNAPKSSKPKQPAAGSRPKGPRSAGSRDAKVSPAGKGPRGRKRKHG